MEPVDMKETLESVTETVKCLREEIEKSGVGELMTNIFSKISKSKTEIPEGENKTKNLEEWLQSLNGAFHSVECKDVPVSFKTNSKDIPISINITSES